MLVAESLFCLSGEKGPNITKKRPGDVPEDQEKWRGIADKLKHFSDKPGKGD